MNLVPVFGGPLDGAWVDPASMNYHDDEGNQYGLHQTESFVHIYRFEAGRLVHDSVFSPKPETEKAE